MGYHNQRQNPNLRKKNYQDADLYKIYGKDDPPHLDASEAVQRHSMQIKRVTRM
jgi:hypothetical protein